MEIATAKAKFSKKTTANLNLRKTASSKSASLLVIPKNTTVSVIRSSTGWDQVSYAKKTGWVSSKYLTGVAVPSESKPKASVYRYLKSFQALRQKASASSTSLTGVIRKTKVQRLGSSGAWTRIKIGRAIGFVPTNQLSSSMPAAVYRYTKSAQSVYKSASTRATTVTRVASGAKIEWLRTSGSWAYVSASGVRGWISAKQLSSTKPVVNKVLGNRWVITSTVVRQGNWNQSKSLGTIKSGEKVGLYLSKGSWSKVRTTRGTGWVPTKNLVSSYYKPYSATFRWTVKQTALRSNNAGSSRHIGTVPKNEKVSMYGTANGWARVKTSKGIGWVATRELTASKPVTNVLKGNRWTVKSVAVRASASTKAKSYGVIRVGEKVGFYAASGSWSQVKTSRGTGWVATSSLVNSAYKPLNKLKRWTTSNVHLRAGYSVTHQSLGVVTKHQLVTALGSANGWIRVSTSKGTGWISSGYLSTTAPKKPAPDLQETNNYRWTTANVNLRAGAGVTHQSKGVVPSGEKVTYLKSSTGWANVKTSRGYGWIKESYLSQRAPATLQPDARRVMKAIDGRFSDTVSYIHTIRSGSVGHSAGKAVDLMIRDYKNKRRIAQGDELAQFLIDNRAQLGIYYLIWQDQIWLPVTGWNEYSGSGKYGNQFSNNWNDTTLHLDHIHVEVYGDSGTDGRLDLSALAR
ncbi:SH3 domain-containing protein [Glutamicibacter arilaitensis]|uniref:SH3 domain-containing protein n=1 Tax=Glutamicibacter arilaitensis TaxID=256701 RepID=UPI00384B3EFE